MVTGVERLPRGLTHQGALSEMSAITGPTGNTFPKHYGYSFFLGHMDTALSRAMYYLINQHRHSRRL
ncbi:hypothetical protein Misp01_17450 [Microtetraspora sp. NBRC 13810]|nr:hypothetical protein Misp01_17450 [Microtetraspora sp. NBRC 13810]